MPGGNEAIENAFLQDILEHPEDDAPRLIYADWLLDRGDPEGAIRAEFIQIQCQLARWSQPLADWDEWADANARTPALQAREKALLAEHGARWAAPLGGVVKGYEFCRGFVERVTIPLAAFLEHGERLLSLFPICHVRFKESWARLHHLAVSPLLGRLSGLDFTHNYLGHNGLSVLLASPHLGRLRELNFSLNSLTDEGVRVLVVSPYLRQLTSLDLSRNQLTPESVRLLIASQYRGQLQTLNLDHNPGLATLPGDALASWLSGNPDHRTLRFILEQAGRELVFRNQEARELTRRAGQDPAGSLAVLQQGLHDSSRKVRAAAAQALGRLGSRATSAVPGLVQRLHDRDALVRGNAASALARLLSALPEELQRWLCRLANPLHSAEVNLGSAPDGREELPAKVASAFIALCGRRAVWLARNAGETNTSTEKTEGQSPEAAVQAVLAWVEKGNVRERERECAWLLGRLCELLQGDAGAG